MTTFSELDLDPRVLKAISEAGYESPTPIQEQAIPHALQGRDVLGIAQTGTGKTASFTLPMLTLLAKGRARARMPRTLVLAPTRELAAQVAENFETYSKHMKLNMALLIGGVSFKDQDKLIDRGVDVLIATPGRLLDHFERGKLMLTGIEIMVVDEADRMLDMGFIPDIERIFKLTPFTRQTMFYSATMAPEITRITNEFLSNPVRVEVARQATTAETIEQVVCKHRPSRRDRSDSEKREVLRRLIDAEGDKLTNGIIFCNRKRDVDVVAKSLKKHGYDAGPIHGDLDQSVRTRTLDGFRNNELRLLIASDVAARGLDIPAVSHVFNFDIPIHSEDYVHRIGRTGRAGRSGKAISLALPADDKYLEKIEELVGKTIPVIPSPLGNTAAAPEVEDSDQGDKPKRSRSRSRSSSKGKPEEQQAGADQAAEAQQPEAAPAPQPAEPERQPDSGSRRDQRDTSRSGGRGRGRSGGGGGGGRGGVVGMGDHVPAFLTRDLRPSLEQAAASRAKSQYEEEEEPEEEDAVTEIDTPEATPAEETPKPKKTRSRRKKKTEDAPQPEATPETVAETEAEPKVEAESEPKAEADTPPSAEDVTQEAAKAPEADETPAPEAKKAKPRTRKPRATKAKAAKADAEADAPKADAAPAEGDASSDAPAEKPAESPAPAAPAEATASETPELAPAEKPKRVRKPRARASAAKVIEDVVENLANAETTTED
ncbi:DEAD/DEAH box helicase [Oceanibium sediminis]|uniref:DEAD/DEAH box helicase n=1 Tax=Oceanibium sediminis TaxID=2026339 RepID=UPI000DD3484D